MASYKGDKVCTPGQLGFSSSKIKHSAHNPGDEPMASLPKKPTTGKSQDLTKKK
jgi:hypothetical protein